MTLNVIRKLDRLTGFDEKDIMSPCLKMETGQKDRTFFQRRDGSLLLVGNMQHSHFIVDDCAIDND